MERTTTPAVLAMNHEICQSRGRPRTTSMTSKSAGISILEFSKRMKYDCEVRSVSERPSPSSKSRIDALRRGYIGMQVSAIDNLAESESNVHRIRQPEFVKVATEDVSPLLVLLPLLLKEPKLRTLLQPGRHSLLKRADAAERDPRRGRKGRLDEVGRTDDPADPPAGGGEGLAGRADGYGAVPEGRRKRGDADVRYVKGETVVLCGQNSGSVHGVGRVKGGRDARLHPR